MRVRSRGVGVSILGGVALVMAVAATAWACTVQNHSMTINPIAGVNGTNVTVAGHCKSSGVSGHDCTDSGNRNLYMDTKSSIEAVQIVLANNQLLGDHQGLCTTSDQDIGSVTAIDSNDQFTGTGTISDPPLIAPVPQQSRTRIPGGYIVCAGISPEMLWDYFNLI